MAEETGRDAYFKGLTRQEYIQKAYEIIQSEGIHAVSIRRIAKELGCSSASLYRYFENLSELLYYAELRTLSSYIDSLNEAGKSWKCVWDIYVGVWECYSREAFLNPEAYNLLFFEFSNVRLRKSFSEYYEMYPEDLRHTNKFFFEMLHTPNFMARDFEMCRKCIRAGAISYDNAIQLNRMVCMIFEGYFKNVLDEGIEEEEIDARVRMLVEDIECVVWALASDMKGYKGYYNRGK